MQCRFALHSDVNNGDGPVTWSALVDVASALCVCVIAVVTARLPTRGLDLVVSLYQMECIVPMALRQRVPHDGGLLCAVQFVFTSLLQFRF